MEDKTCFQKFLLKTTNQIENADWKWSISPGIARSCAKKKNIQDPGEDFKLIVVSI